MKLAATEWLSQIPEFKPPTPKDSALGILLRRTDQGWEVLMARRARTSRFMPGHYAFPGGRLDAEDLPNEPGAFERCVQREIHEEIGVDIPAKEWIDVGERITPPLFPVRFRTKFYLALWPEGQPLPDEPPSPQELEEIVFEDAAQSLTEWEHGRMLAPPCLPILRVLKEQPTATMKSLAEAFRSVNEYEQQWPRIEFMPDVWVLPVRTRTIPPATHTNVWLPGVTEFVAIDPGSDRPEELERLSVVIQRKVDLGGQFKAIVVTHAHPDHVAGVEALAKRWDVPVWAHALALERMNLPAEINSRTLDHGDRIELGTQALIAHFTPGHAPDHLVFELEGKQTLISGDLHSGLSTILIHPPEGNMSDYLKTLLQVGNLDVKRLFPAHGFPLPAKALAKVHQHRLDREAKILSCVTAEYQPIAAIAKEAYAEVPKMPAFLIEAQALGHLERLQSLGQVECDSGTGSSRGWRRVEP